MRVSFKEGTLDHEHKEGLLKKVHTTYYTLDAEVIFSEEEKAIIDHYKKSLLSDATADQIIMQLYRRDVINVTRIAEVVEAWERPVHDWGHKTLWRLFNCVTFVLTGKVVANPATTRMLHNVLDESA